MKQFPLFIIAFILVTILMTLHNNKPEETPKVEETEEPMQPDPQLIMKILNEYGDTFKAGDTIEIQQQGNNIQIKSIHPKSE